MSAERDCPMAYVDGSAIRVKMHGLIEGTYCVVIENTDDDQYRGYCLSPDALTFQGFTVAKTGWNSDSRSIHYSTLGLIARPVERG